MIVGKLLFWAPKKIILPEVIYWGPRLHEDEDLVVLFEAYSIDVTGGMLDQNPELSICPEATRSFPGQPGLVVRNMDGSPLLPQFCFSKAIENENDIRIDL